MLVFFLELCSYEERSKALETIIETLQEPTTFEDFGVALCSPGLPAHVPGGGASTNTTSAAAQSSSSLSGTTVFLSCWPFLSSFSYFFLFFSFKPSNLGFDLHLIFGRFAFGCVCLFGWFLFSFRFWLPTAAGQSPAIGGISSSDWLA